MRTVLTLAALTLFSLWLLSGLYLIRAETAAGIAFWSVVGALNGLAFVGTLDDLFRAWVRPAAR